MENLIQELSAFLTNFLPNDLIALIVDYFGRYVTGGILISRRRKIAYANGVYWENLPEFYEVIAYYPEANMLEAFRRSTGVWGKGWCEPMPFTRHETAFVDLDLCLPIMKKRKRFKVTRPLSYLMFRPENRWISHAASVTTTVLQMIKEGAHATTPRNILFCDTLEYYVLPNEFRIMAFVVLK